VGILTRMPLRVFVVREKLIAVTVTEGPLGHFVFPVKVVGDGGQVTLC